LGSFRDDSIDGFGCIFKEKKKVFEGEFRQGKMHGPGIFYFLNGNIFVGNFVENERRGFGRFSINQEGSSVREIEAIFDKNDQMRIVGVTLTENEDRNLNTLEHRNRVLRQNDLDKVSSYTWRNLKTLSKNQRVSAEKLQEFEKKMVSKQINDSDDSDVSTLNFQNDSDVGVDSMEEKSEKSEESDNSDFCDDFECFNSNWSSDNGNKNKLCEKCMEKEVLHDNSDDDFLEDLGIKNHIQNNGRQIAYKRGELGMATPCETLEKLIKPIDMRHLQRYSRDELNKVF
jgi:hypothetical protein